jgi:hypothetical protein
LEFKLQTAHTSSKLKTPLKFGSIFVNLQTGAAEFQAFYIRVTVENVRIAKLNCRVMLRKFVVLLLEISITRPWAYP